VTKVFTLVWPLLAIGFILKEGMPRVSPRGGHHWRALPWGVASGVVMVGAMLGLMQTPMRDVVLGGADAIRAKTESLGMLRHYWTFAVLLSVVHSLLEEYYWRWFVYGRLRHLVPDLAAHALAGAAFSLHHIVVVSQYFSWGWGLVLGGMTGVGGMIWSWMYRRQGTVAGAWISHMIVDFGLLSLGYWVLTRPVIAAF
jgi:membrane protease YdiL (CAAX protease family)